MSKQSQSRFRFNSIGPIADMMIMISLKPCTLKLFCHISLFSCSYFPSVQSVVLLHIFVPVLCVVQHASTLLYFVVTIILDWNVRWLYFSRSCFARQCSAVQWTLLWHSNGCRYAESFWLIYLHCEAKTNLIFVPAFCFNALPQVYSAPPHAFPGVVYIQISWLK